MKSIPYCIGTLLLGGLLACGGGFSSSSSSTPGLGFTSTASTSSYRFVKNATLSTDTRLALDLLGPQGTAARGVALYLATDGTKVEWVNPSTGATTGSLVTTGSAFTLGSAPQLVSTKAEGATLQVGAFQKGGAAATYGTTPILTIGLALKSGTSKGTVLLGAQSGKTSIALNGDASPTNVGITVDCGSVSVQ